MFQFYDANTSNVSQNELLSKEQFCFFMEKFGKINEDFRLIHVERSDCHNSILIMYIRFNEEIRT
ncbi:hypothetical protein [Effusibacillus consociatus]|uniref:Uncharacterized protein n=1 Tax=Effusibacillus consociatus TaxID=1117041 RepID=A0ABV9Q1F4_9BACL